MSIITALSQVATGVDPERHVRKVLFSNPSPSGRIFSKSEVLSEYSRLKNDGAIQLSEPEEARFLDVIRMKSVRTISGVTPVTVLTKPFPCPGKCIFCPNDVRMPKSYLSNEPGAQRAEANKFDPYYQTYNRLVALKNIGHPTDKVEIIILGGTWTAYPVEYQMWFVNRVFEALNDFGKNLNPEPINPEVMGLPYLEKNLENISGDKINLTYNQVVTAALRKPSSDTVSESATFETLYESHKLNETSPTKCVGLVIETRPDEITEEEVIRMRKLGATKVQLGVQSLNNKVLSLNNRGHDVDKTAQAFKLLRDAGFKIHVHWMPNLLGSDPKKDIEDYKKLFEDPRFKPDEIKIYPCSLIESAELMRFYKSGEWKPYSQEELLHVLTEAFKLTPRYCRITRMIRDIPSTDIVDGNLKTNFRQIVEQNLKSINVTPVEIRSREVKELNLTEKDLSILETDYETEATKEKFIEYITKEDKVAGFLRLSLPNGMHFIEELSDSAIIREVHVYGRSLEIGEHQKGKAQHLGLGRKLIDRAVEISKKNGFKTLSVISSVGTREYYKKLGFEQSGLYQQMSL
ncbi:hypothetical protein A2415_03455 [candidate division WWE3 bacterium RIFOXYC1_FULL_39_7]|uniref:tRNA carboxymethyluridine synthase n=2 Tax=Katanobacteria TaxID=422282 RepID=A0A1F4X9K7_UNCKA|nr:MAG: hypothetical protein A2415_03455 [candidate division WWE3 bacterium RIFOXYC1_FULL_39_7]OGC78377.1 MAG: hypothetical protein A2619_05040 [candidate division WWE3 bacterium RIFOXYD1_FULL_39_9]